MTPFFTFFVYSGLKVYLSNGLSTEIPQSRTEKMAVQIILYAFSYILKNHDFHHFQVSTFLNDLLMVFIVVVFSFFCKTETPQK